MYEYNFINPKVFYIELLKTLQVKEKAVFPRCSLSEGTLPNSDTHQRSVHLEEVFLDEFIDEVDEDEFGDGFMEEQIWDDSQTEFDSF
jgi:hypothetical protein